MSCIGCWRVKICLESDHLALAWKKILQKQDLKDFKVNFFSRRLVQKDVEKHYDLNEECAQNRKPEAQMQRQLWHQKIFCWCCVGDSWHPEVEKSFWKETSEKKRVLEIIIFIMNRERSTLCINAFVPSTVYTYLRGILKETNIFPLPHLPV